MFEIESGLSFELSATSTDGYALFQEPVPYGSLDIRGSGPNTHQFLRAFCGEAPFIGIGAIPSTWTSSTQPQLTFPAQVNYQVVCEFYVVPLSTAVEPAASPEASSADVEAPDTASSPATAEEADPAPEPAATPEEDDEGAGSTPTPAIVASQGENSGSDESTTQPAAPETATLLLNLHTCPVAYDVYAQGADPTVDCARRTGAPSVTVDGAASETSADGVAGWTGLPTGVVTIESGAGAFLGVCSSDLRTVSDSVVAPYVFANPDGAIGIALLAGETLTCDWYAVADGESGTVSASLLVCPGPTVIEAQCESAPGPATLHFEPVDGDGTEFDLQIDESGFGQANATGTYQLTGFPEGSCSIESDGFDATGALVIEPEAAVEVRIYLCGP